MPESPDFDQIAREVLTEALAVIEAHAEEYPTARPVVAALPRALAAQLRQVWNARGAADRVLVNAAATGVAPEPPDLGVTHLTSVSIRKARRDWWREGFVAGARETARALAAVDPQGDAHTGTPPTRVS